MKKSTLEMYLNITKDSTQEDIEAVIKSAADDYYGGESILTDAQFDSLVDRLRQMNPNAEILNTVAWGYKPKVGERQKVTHKFGIVGSLSKIHSTREIPSEIIDIYGDGFLATPKLDGLSVVLYYTDGKLMNAVTRGDGNEGINVTDKITKIMNGNTDTYMVKFSGAIRGEIIVDNESWKAVKVKYPEAKNQRNFASGVVNRGDVTADLKYLSMILYNVIAMHDFEKYSITSQKDILNLIEDMFPSLTPIENFRFNVKPSSENLDILEKSFSDMYEAYKKRIPVDGIVLTRDRIKTFQDLALFGAPMKIHLDQIAYKFAAEDKDCHVTGVEWNMTRTGRLVPTVHIETVELSGTSVSKATGFNAKYILENRIGNGAIVNIMKANEIIPDIQYVVRETPLDEIVPTVCPACGSLLIWDGVDLRCDSTLCPSKEFRDLQCFICTIGATENIGWAIMEKCLTELNISSVGDLLAYGYNPIDDKGQKQRKLFNEVLKKVFVDPVDATDALCALNIPRLGRVSASKLASNKAVLDKTMSELMCHGYLCSAIYDLSTVVGNATALSMNENCKKLEILDYLWQRLVFNQPENTSDMIEVCITGKLSVKRSVFEDELKKYGYKSSGIGKNTKYLITDDPNGSSSKNKKATELGIEKISEADFRERFMK